MSPFVQEASHPSPEKLGCCRSTLYCLVVVCFTACRNLHCQGLSKEARMLSRHNALARDGALNHVSVARVIAIEMQYNFAQCRSMGPIELTYTMRARAATRVLPHSSAGTVRAMANEMQCECAMHLIVQACVLLSASSTSTAKIMSGHAHVP
jgi:hypothetical protein